MPSVYGVKVSKRAFASATNFLHTQSALCGWSMCSGIISLIFTLIMLSQLQPLFDLQATAPTSEGIPTRDVFVANVSKHAWGVALTQLCEAACLGSILVAIGRHFIETGSSGGMRLCCVVDGVYSVCGLCQGFLGCIGFIFLCSAVSQMDDAATLCAKYSASSTPAPTAAAAGTTAAPFFATTATCPEILAALKTPATTFLLWIGTLICTVCIVAGICGAGSKFAAETHEIFEDEEEAQYGDFE